MKHLFTLEGLRSLDAVLARRPLLAFDFDGTLAPIVPRPDDARAPGSVVRSLRLLRQRWPVAVVSGRSVDDLRPRLGSAATYLVGCHGSQGVPGAQQDWSCALDGARSHLAGAFADRLQAVGVSLEDKGASLALHYRLADDQAAAWAAVQAAVCDLGPEVRCFGGKLVVNVVPAQAPDKFEAVSRLVAHTGSDCAVFLGDDVNDEPVFEAASPRWLTVRVGRELCGSRAQYFVESTSEVTALLRRMAQMAA